jgi:hypothetical protein
MDGLPGNNSLLSPCPGFAGKAQGEGRAAKESPVILESCLHQGVGRGDKNEAANSQRNPHRRDQ